MNTPTNPYPEFIKQFLQTTEGITQPCYSLHEIHFFALKEHHNDFHLGLSLLRNQLQFSDVSEEKKTQEILRWIQRAEKSEGAQHDLIEKVTKLQRTLLPSI